MSYQKLVDILGESIKRCHGQSIALSGGLDSSIIAYFLREKRPRGVCVIAKDFVATDLTYCQKVASSFEIPLDIFFAKTDQILDAVEKTTEILGNFNDIEIRNQVTSYLAISWAKENGFSSIVTGDGADELFAGYNFMLYKNEEELKEEQQRLLSVMDFPSKKIGSYFGIKVETPFLDEKVIEFAKSLPHQMLINKKGEKQFGKWILRKAFEEKLPESIVWRQKSPMQEGSGTAGLSDFFASIIPEESFKSKSQKILDEDKIKIRSKESLYYYEIFRRHFPKIKPTGITPSCPFCNYTVKQESKFCKMCGAFPI